MLLGSVLAAALNYMKDSLPTESGSINNAYFKFERKVSKLHVWEYQSRGVIPSVADQNSDGMSPDHP